MILFLFWLMIGACHYLHNSIKNFAIAELVTFGYTVVVLNVYIIFRMGVSIFRTLKANDWQMIKIDTPEPDF